MTELNHLLLSPISSAGGQQQQTKVCNLNAYQLLAYPLHKSCSMRLFVNMEESKVLEEETDDNYVSFQDINMEETIYFKEDSQVQENKRL